MNDFWADQHFDFDDAVNQEILGQPPTCRARLAALNTRVPAGGWDDRSATCPLPWVPHRVGRECESKVRSGLSAYARFVCNSASRAVVMPEAEYAGSRSAVEWSSLSKCVILPDATYYRSISEAADDVAQC